MVSFKLIGIFYEVRAPKIIIFKIFNRGSRCWVTYLWSLLCSRSCRRGRSRLSRCGRTSLSIGVQLEEVGANIDCIPLGGEV